jgi:cell division septal protein FtsQ
MVLTTALPAGVRRHARGAGMPTYGDEPVSPFLRRRQDERMKGGRRRRRTLRLLPAAMGLLALVVLAGAAWGVQWWLTHSPRFNVARVAFTTTEHATAADLKKAGERARGKNIFRLDLDALAADLRKVRWVRSVTIRRVLPDRLFCAVEEREARGLALMRGRVQMIDSDGSPIDLYTADEGKMSMPIFTGLDEIRAAHARDQMARGLDFVAWLDGTHPGLAAEISEIDLARDDRIVLTMNNGGPPVRVNPDDYAANLDAWLKMRDWLATHFGDGAYVDLRFKDRIAFQPATARKN